MQLLHSQHLLSMYSRKAGSTLGMPIRQQGDKRQTREAQGYYTQQCVLVIKSHQSDESPTAIENLEWQADRTHSDDTDIRLSAYLYTRKDWLVSAIDDGTTTLSRSIHSLCIFNLPITDHAVMPCKKTMGG